MAVVNGIIFGLTLTVLLGPVFFTLLQTSLEKGFSKAVIVAVGVSFGDILIISLVYFGFSSLLDFEENKELIALGGSIILLAFGIAAIFKSRKSYIRRKETKEVKGFFRFLFMGLIINALSPFVTIFWIGTMSLATVKYSYEGLTLFIFFATVVAVVFATDVIKAFLAQKLTAFINVRVMKFLNITVGIILILFAIRMATYY